VTSEWERFIRAQRGDETAWRVLVGQHQTRMTALALMITGSAAAADDVVQETFVRALRAKIKSYTGTVQGFLNTIAYRLALKEAQRIKRNVKLDGLDLTDTAHNPLETILCSERDRLIAETIGSLDVGQRDVLILRLYNGCSYREIAKIQQVPLGTVKSRMFYAVKTCRERLQRKGVFS
jgi:RNA polymerase sigma-70 factor (ECF subfamily)